MSQADTAQTTTDLWSAAIGVEASVWHIVTLLRLPERVQEGVALLDRALGLLDGVGPSKQADELRLVLAHRLLRVKQPTLAERTLGPLLAGDHGETAQREAEAVILTRSPVGELQLQRIALLQRSQHLELGAPYDDAIVTSDALADVCARLGDWPTALGAATQLRPLRESNLGPDHPDTLTTRKHRRRDVIWQRAT
jgi:hypothetical protein